MKSSLAKWEPVAYKGLKARTKRRAVILHTNGAGVVGSRDEDLFAWWSSVAAGHQLPNVGTQIGAQLQGAIDGSLYQYVDLDLVVYHAFDASEWAMGYETEDDGNPDKPWSASQLDQIIAFCREQKAPGQELKEGPSDGVGWHQKYRSWNQHGHNCPGAVRVAQIRSVIIPALNEEEDDDMGLSQATIDYLDGQRKAANDFFNDPQTPNKNRPDKKDSPHGADGYDSEWAKLQSALA